MRRIVELIGVAALVSLVWITWRAFTGPNPLPERIPTHFDAAGNPNGWGSPAALVLLPGLGIAIYLAISIASRIPSAFHYPVQVTTVNLPRVQEVTLDLLTWIKAEMACMFAALQWWMIEAARSGGVKLPSMLIPAFLVLIFATVGGYMFAVIRVACSGADSN